MSDLASNVDLAPAAHALAGLLAGIGDDQLGAPTPCDESTLGDLLDHVDQLSTVFIGAATKSRLPEVQPVAPDSARLGPDWRQRIPRQLSSLADAWGADEAWVGTTRAGGRDLPSDMAGVIALNEVVVHGWDIAVASGQPVRYPPALLQAAYQFVQATVADSPEGSPGMFAAPVEWPDDAPLLERLVALTGRDPEWRPPGPS
jgi:uncharacterized protein (TIGR03086 family)